MSMMGIDRLCLACSVKPPGGLGRGRLDPPPKHPPPHYQHEHTLYSCRRNGTPLHEYGGPVWVCWCLHTYIHGHIHTHIHTYTVTWLHGYVTTAIGRDRCVRGAPCLAMHSTSGVLGSVGDAGMTTHGCTLLTLMHTTAASWGGGRGLHL